ncbi:Ionotropic glutamate receptor [Trinorchestia longiramus]|nr:Ionotropic glutamate receptor [Trinorchestia longiramus]
MSVAQYLDKTDIYLSIRTEGEDDSRADLVFRRLRMQLLKSRSGIQLHESLSDTVLNNLTLGKYNSRSSSAASEFARFRTNSTTQLHREKKIEHKTHGRNTRTSLDDKNTEEFVSKSIFETEKIAGKADEEKTHDNFAEFNLGKLTRHKLKSASKYKSLESIKGNSNGETENIGFETPSRTWSFEFMNYRQRRWQRSHHPCHFSAPKTPAKRSEGCPLDRWPLQVYLADSASLVMSVSEAEAQYQLDFGAVTQVVIMLDATTWTSLLPTAFSVPGSSSKMLLAHYNSNTEEAELWNVYKFRDSDHIVQKMGKWTRTTGMEVIASFHDGLKDFQGNTIHFGNIMLSTDSNDDPEPFDCAEEYQYEVVLLDEIAFGGGYADDCFGLVGKLCKREADAAVTAIVLSAGYRKDVLDGTFPVDIQQRILLYNKAREVTTFRWTTFVEGLDWRVWIVVAVVTAVSTITAVWVTRVLNSSDPQYRTLVEGGLLHTSILLQQGWPTVPSSATLRMVFFNYALMSLVLFAFYNGRLVSFLSSTRYVRPFNSLEEAIMNDWNVVTFKGSLLHTALLTLDDNWAAGFNKKVREDPNSIVIKSRREAFHKVETSQTAFYEFSTNLLIEAQERQGLCRYDYVFVGGVKTDLYITVEKNLPFKQVFTNTIFKLQATGIVKRIKNKRRFIKPVACDTNVFLAFGFLNTVSAFVMLAAGCVLAWVILAVELVVKSLQQTRGTA